MEIRHCYLVVLLIRLEKGRRTKVKRRGTEMVLETLASANPIPE